MGTDIHLYVERKCKSLDKWLVVNPTKAELLGYLAHEPREDSPLYAMAHAGLPIEEREPENALKWRIGRNYQLFGLLAGVRGRRADCVTGNPRGLPNNVSEKVRGLFERWGMDAHTPSWLTYGELESDVFLYRSVNSFGLGVMRDEMKETISAYNLSNDELRAVFWFDN